MKKLGRDCFSGILALIFIQLSTPTPSAFATAPPATGPAIATSTGPGFLQSTFFQTKPPPYSESSGQGFLNIFTSCFNMSLPMQTIISSMAMRGGAGGMSSICTAMAAGITATTVCSGSDQSPIGNMGGMGGGMIGMGGCPANAKLIESQLDLAYCAAMCKYGKAQAAQQELKCLTNQASNLSQQLGSTNNIFSQNIQLMEKQVQQIKTVQDDRVAQQADVENRLGGDSASGAIGLIAQQAATQQEIAKIKQEALALQTAQQTVTRAQQVLGEQVQVRTMALAMDCFNNQAMPGYTCTQNGPPMSASEYLKCRYRQTHAVGPGGVVDRSSTATAQATSSEQALDAVLSALSSDAPSKENATILTDPTALANAANTTPVTVLSVADEMSRYGGRLSQFQIGGTDAGQFVSGALSYCYSLAHQTVTTEQGRTSSTVGNVRSQIRAMEQANDTNSSQIINEASQQYSSNMNSLTGQSLPLNTSACVGAAPAVELSCVNQLGTTLNHLLMGDTPVTAMVGQIKGNNPQTYLPLNCHGLNGCIAQMQYIDRNIKVDEKNLANMKSNYILSANQTTNQYARNLAASMSPQIANINNQLKQMGVNIPPVPGEEPQFDADGLVKPPTNPLNYIGQYSNPPMPDMSGEALTSASTKFEEDQNKANQQLAQLQSDKNTFENMMHQCQQNGETGNALAGSLGRAQGDASELTNANCGTAFTQSDCLAKYVELTTLMAKIEGTTTAENVSISDLQAGLKKMCSQAKTGQNTKQTASNVQCTIAYESLKSSLTAAGNASDNAAKVRSTAGSAMGMGMFGGGMGYGNPYGGMGYNPYQQQPPH